MGLNSHNGKLGATALAGSIGLTAGIALAVVFRSINPFIEMPKPKRPTFVGDKGLGLNTDSNDPRESIPVVEVDSVPSIELQNLLAHHPFVITYEPAIAPSKVAASAPVEASGEIQVQGEQGPVALRVTLLRGKFSLPIIRVDDYPTGVRPILKDRRPLMNVIEAMEAMNYPYHLGISPGLLSRSDVAFLKGCKNMVPCLHGFDHNYWKYATQLMEAGDEFNSDVNSLFGSLLHRVRYKLRPNHQSEFNQLHQEMVTQRIGLGKERLEDDTGKPVTVYTAPFDRPIATVGRALDELGFSAYLSQNEAPGCSVPWITSDFYGKSSGLVEHTRPLCICLHTLWEWDIVRKGGKHEIERVGVYARNVRDEFEAAAKATSEFIQSQPSIKPAPIVS